MNHPVTVTAGSSQLCRAHEQRLPARTSACQGSTQCPAQTYHSERCELETAEGTATAMCADTLLEMLQQSTCKGSVACAQPKNAQVSEPK